ncbi:hypothetical protein [Limnoglobus roseus]|uniref:Uncharacterized protein n=1 Tax=Limnoglobus roseus TaxID=2598579 RepID=A0A5C1ABI5_9BACT|nr:hypothetical protein [Limnoglobus roseus]QEL15945.1 hypothetical protein PX52LOC_02882 [Limnoglobus roseus]
MNKIEERAALDAVFGIYPLIIKEQERPDFRCLHPTTGEFGVEVTEFHASESDARLRNIRNYPLDIIKNGKYRHKDDVGEICVEEVVYHVAATGQQIPLRAIPRRVPTVRECVPKIVDMINDKGMKCAGYDSDLRSTDLIISDLNNAVRLNRVGEFLGCLHDYLCGSSAVVMVSPLREVYLLCLCGEIGRVCIPIYGNLFVGEIAVFDEIYSRHISALSEDNTVGRYLATLAAHLAARFPGTVFSESEGDVSFKFASTVWTLSAEQKVFITDMRCGDELAWEALSSESNVDPFQASIFNDPEQGRVNEFRCYELHFPVPETRPC